jgi:ferredoxin-type protein NapH
VQKLRLKVQLATAALLNIGLFQWHNICFPVLNCHSCPTSIFACPVGVVGQFASIGVFPLMVFGGVALAGLLVGRILCGWACPFGMLQDLLYKVPYLKFSIPPQMRYIKYGVLLVLVILVPIFLSPHFALYFCRICPVATLESAIPWAIINGSTDPFGLGLRLVVLFATIILVMGHHRFFCKVICPLGAGLAFFNRFAGIFPRRNSNCIDCGACHRVCPMETGREHKRFGVYDNQAEECISCLDCKKKCPTEAIKLWG